MSGVSSPVFPQENSTESATSKMKIIQNFDLNTIIFPLFLTLMEFYHILYPIATSLRKITADKYLNRLDIRCFSCYDFTEENTLRKGISA